MVMTSSVDRALVVEGREDVESVLRLQRFSSRTAAKLWWGNCELQGLATWDIQVSLVHARHGIVRGYSIILPASVLQLSNHKLRPKAMCLNFVCT